MPRASLTSSVALQSFFQQREIDWIKGSPPSGQPKCGFDGSKCKPNKHRKLTSLLNKHRKLTSLPNKHRKLTSLPNKHRKLTLLPNKHRKLTSLPNKHRELTSLPKKHRKLTSLPNKHLKLTSPVPLLSYTESCLPSVYVLIELWNARPA